MHLPLKSIRLEQPAVFAAVFSAAALLFAAVAVLAFLGACGAAGFAALAGAAAAGAGAAALWSRRGNGSANARLRDGICRLEPETARGASMTAAGFRPDSDESFFRMTEMIEHLQSNRSFNEVLKYVYDSFADYLPYTHIGVARVFPERNSVRAVYGISDPRHAMLKKQLLGYEVSLNATSLGRVLREKRPRIINDLEGYLKGKPLQPYNRILLSAGIRSSITFPLINNDTPIGILFFSSDRANAYRRKHIEFLQALAKHLMLSFEKSILSNEMILSSTLAMATMTEERDEQTGQHLERMKRYSRLLAELLSQGGKYSGVIDPAYVDAIEQFSPLHDIGKVSIRDAILLKPGKLTPEEFEIMKTHTVYGGKVLRMADENLKRLGHSIFKMGIEIAEGHHERWDGKGYPRGLAGEQIPLSARIVALADVFDALTSKRQYKEAFDFNLSAGMIRSESGSHFDPEIVRVFLENIDRFREIYLSFNVKAERKARAI